MGSHADKSIFSNSALRYLGRSQLLVRRRSFIPNEVNSKWKIAHFGKAGAD